MRVLHVLVLLGGWLPAAVAAPSDSHLLTELLEQARALAREGQTEQAAARYEDALRRAEEAAETEVATLAVVANELAHLRRNLGDDAGAESLYRRSLEWLEAHRGTTHPDVAASLYNLAGLHYSTLRLDTAAELYRRALEIWTMAWGPAHPHALKTLEELAALETDAGLLEAAAVDYGRLLALRESLHGRGSPELLPALQALARIEAERGHLQVADEHHRRALALIDPQRQPLEAAAVLAHLALLAVRQGLPDLAEERYQQSLSLYERHAPAHPDHAATLNNLAALHIGAERDADAEPLLVKALTVSEAAFGTDDVALVPTLANLAALHTRRGRPEVSLELTGRAVSLLEPQLEHLESRDRGSLGFHGSLWLDLLLLHRENLERAGAVEAPLGPDAATASSSGEVREHWAQVGSRQDPEEARRDLERLSATFPDLLEGLPHRLQRVELEERGVWHRMQVGPFARRSTARRLCEQLAARRYQDCLVLRLP